MISEEAYRICIYKKKRIKKYEPIILKDSYYSYLYALYIIKQRWLEAEPNISTDPYYSYYYTKNVIKRRWLEVEPLIEKDGVYWKHYCFHFNIKKDKVNWRKGF